MLASVPKSGTDNPSFLGLAHELQGQVRFTRKLENPAGKTPHFSQLFMKLRV